MSTPRRRLVCPFVVTAPTNQQRLRPAQKLRGRLTRDWTALNRWMSRHKRAFHWMEKFQLRISRGEQQITRLEEP